MPRDPFKLHTPARIAFSAGRTSAYMLWRILKAFGGVLPPNILVTLANTGQEDEKSLEFARDIERHWGVPVRWLEYCRDEDAPTVLLRKSKKTGKDLTPWIGCHDFIEVDFESASRAGEPFEAIINVKADYRAEAKGESPILPNPTDRWCSGEMKHRTMDRFMRSLGYEEYTVAVGLRADEPKRVSDMRAQSTQKIEYECPLATARIDLAEVMAFWRTQPFDLGLTHDPVLGTYEGNCKLCFLKSNAKMNRLIRERPEEFDWWAEMEEKTGAKFRRDRVPYRAMADRRVELVTCEDDRDINVCLCTD